MKKRLFSFALVFLLAFTALSPGVFAEGGEDVDVPLEDQYIPQFSVESVLIGNDDTEVTVKIEVEKNGGFAGMIYQILFDKDVLAFEEVVPSSKIEMGYIPGPDEDGQHTGIFTWEENVHGDGEILTYKFKVNPEASAGTHEIKLLISGKIELPDGTMMDLAVIDENGTVIDGVTAVDGSVTIPGYTVTYDANGGSGAPEGGIKSKNKPYTVSSYKPTRENYECIGWATTPDAAAVEYAFGSKYIENRDVTFYAVWEKQDLIAGTADITISTVDAKAGDEVELLVSIANNPGFAEIQFDVTFDSTRLEYISAKKVFSEALDGFMYVEPNPEETVDTMTIALTNAIANTPAENLDLVKLKFKVLDEAQDGFAEVAISPVKMRKLISLTPSPEYSRVIMNPIDGGVSLVSQLLGDLNLDEAVDMNDAILLLQHSMFSELYPLEYKGSVDFTDDGNIDMNDAILLLQYSMFPGLYPIG